MTTVVCFTGLGTDLSKYWKFGALGVNVAPTMETTNVTDANASKS